MENYILTSSVDKIGCHWAVRPGIVGYLVDYVRRDKVVTCEHFIDVSLALRLLNGVAQLNDLTIDWSKFVVMKLARTTVQSEYKSGARDDVDHFDNQEDFDAWRRERLACYDDESDRDDVRGLLESGHLDAAWDMAVDDDGSKELWNTHFGSHMVTTTEFNVYFTDLPEWIQQSIKLTIAP